MSLHLGPCGVAMSQLRTTRPAKWTKGCPKSQVDISLREAFPRLSPALNNMHRKLTISSQQVQALSICRIQEKSLLIWAPSVYNHPPNLGTWEFGVSGLRHGREE